MSDTCSSNANAQNNAAQWQYYLAEREQLFLKSSSVSVSEMASTLAHELNQPLGAIKNVLNGMQLRLEKDSRVSSDILEAISVASKQTSYAASIIDRIRDFTDRRKPQYSELDVPNLIKESIGLMDWVLASEKVVVEINAYSDECQVVGDKIMLQQVITNLFRNAIDAMRSNDDREKKIVVDIAKDSNNHEVSIAVTDTGHGIDELSQTNLFTPFFTDKTDGMGVGLSICRSFVELHQGRLWLTSKEKNGCTAHIVLQSTSEGDKK